VKNDAIELKTTQLMEAEELFIVELDDRHEMSPLIPPINVIKCTVNSGNCVAGCT
jgi:hypothetical protein